MSARHTNDSDLTYNPADTITVLRIVKDVNVYHS